MTIRKTSAPRVTTNKNIDQVLSKVQFSVKGYVLPIVTLHAKSGADPFKVLIATMLSLRTRDQVTAEVCDRLFAKASTPQAMLKLSTKELEQLLFPVGFYRTKAVAIQETCRRILRDHAGTVPEEIDQLVMFPGVGRKTANLVRILGHQKPGICVDTHVHRISNIWGYVRTKTPDETEMVLRKKLPEKHWMKYNDLLVSFGQHICVPISPKCSVCPLAGTCPRIGVKRSR